MSKVFIRIWLVILIIIAAYIRVHGVGEYHYSEDEAMHIGMAQGQSLQEVLKFSLYETHPPLGHIIRHYWQKISEAVWFERSLSLVFGLLLIPLYYRIGTVIRNEITGMCCAALIAFSYGCITQSYIVRNYMILTFLLSLCLYYYLLWCNGNKKRFLLGYGICASLACLTHFSAIFAVFSIAACGSIHMYRQKMRLENQFQWAGMNIFIAIIAVITYYIWVVYGAVILHPISASFTDLLIVILMNPFVAFQYSVTYLAFIPLVIFFTFMPVIKNDKQLPHFLLLLIIPLLVASFLLAVKRYFPSGTRHGIWSLPFIILFTGWVTGAALAHISTAISKKFNAPALHILLLSIIAIGWLAYNPEKRFADNEYEMPEHDWQELSGYLYKNRGDSLVIPHDHVSNYYNIYPYLDESHVLGESRAVLIKSPGIDLLFPTYEHRGIYDGKLLINMLGFINNKGLLDGTNNLLFVLTKYAYLHKDTAPIHRLLLCPQLEKEIIYFPKPSTNAPLTKENIDNYSVIVLKVAKKDFFDQVVSPTGKAHHCLDGTSIP